MFLIYKLQGLCQNNAKNPVKYTCMVEFITKSEYNVDFNIH